MHSGPDEPRTEAAHSDLPALQDGEALAHDGHAAFVEIMKWVGRAIPDDAAVNKFPCIAPLLYRYLCNSWQRLAVLIERRGIANHEELGVSRNTQVILDAHPPGSVCLHLQPLACRGRRDACGPNYGPTQNAFARDDNTFSVDLIDTVSQPDLDAQLVKSRLCGLRKVLRKWD